MGLAVTCGGPSAGNADLLLMLFDKLAEGQQARVFGKYVFECCPADPAGFAPDGAIVGQIAADLEALAAWRRA